MFTHQFCLTLLVISQLNVYSKEIWICGVYVFRFFILFVSGVCESEEEPERMSQWSRPKGQWSSQQVNVLIAGWSYHYSFSWLPHFPPASHLCPISRTNHKPISLYLCFFGNAPLSPISSCSHFLHIAILHRTDWAEAPWPHTLLSIIKPQYLRGFISHALKQTHHLSQL